MTTSLDAPVGATDAEASVRRASHVETRGPPLGGRIPELDGLRGLAIASVLVWHYVAITAQAPHRSLLSLGLVLMKLTWSGVDLFFVLSGFLIGGILLDARTSSRYFAPFYIRRFFRIVPLYVVVCALFAIGCLAGGARHGEVGAWFFGNPPPWVAFPLFLSNVFVAIRGTFDPVPIGVTWSLAVEEQFYLTLPLLIRYLRPRRLLPVLVAIAICIPFARTAAFYSGPNGGILAYTAMPLRADSLLFGVIAAIVVRRPGAWSALVENRGTLKAAAAVLALGLAVFIAFGWTTHRSAVMCSVGYTWLAALYTAVLLLALTRPGGAIAAALRNQGLRSLGGIAYGTYLFHVAVQGALFWIVFGHVPRITSAAEAGVTVVAAVASIALARASWRLFEAKMVRIGRRARYDEPAAAPRLAA